MRTKSKTLEGSKEEYERGEPGEKQKNNAERIRRRRMSTRKMKSGKECGDRKKSIKFVENRTWMKREIKLFSSSSPSFSHCSEQGRCTKN